MIEFLSGTLIEKAEDHAVVDTGGVGYGVSISARTAAALGEQGSPARLWVRTRMSQDNLSLFGFAQSSEREVFDVFVGISGVGPRLALAVLSSFQVEELIQIVLSQDANALKKVPGIGLKKAEKLLVELKGRVDKLSAGLEPERLAALGSAGSPMPDIASLPTEAARDAVAALEALDISLPIARRAVARALEDLGPEAEVEDLVREGLRHRHSV